MPSAAELLTRPVAEEGGATAPDTITSAFLACCIKADAGEGVAELFPMTTTLRPGLGAVTHIFCITPKPSLFCIPKAHVTDVSGGGALGSMRDNNGTKGKGVRK
jgi:hypothetical protein